MNNCGEKKRTLVIITKLINQSNSTAIISGDKSNIKGDYLQPIQNG